MAKGMTKPNVIREAIKLDVVPGEASVSRKGEACWEVAGLSYVVWFWKDSAGALTWDVHIGDAKFGSLMTEYGGMSVPIRSSQNTMSWPAAVDESLGAFLQGALKRAVGFVSDRRDLCSLLASPESVHRRDCYAWLPTANYPARLVQSLVLARDLGDLKIASEVEGQLRTGEIPLPGGRSVSVYESAKGWARNYAKVLGFEIAF